MHSIVPHPTTCSLPPPHASSSPSPLPPCQAPACLTCHIHDTGTDSAEQASQLPIRLLTALCPRSLQWEISYLTALAGCPPQCIQWLRERGERERESDRGRGGEGGRGRKQEDHLGLYSPKGSVDGRIEVGREERTLPPQSSDTAERGRNRRRWLNRPASGKQKEKKQHGEKERKGERRQDLRVCERNRERERERERKKGVFSWKSGSRQTG